MSVTANMTRQERLAYWRSYLSERTGTYEFRTLRYAAVYDKLLEMGLEDGDQIIDVGAGQCEFARYLYSRGWTGQYVPVDGAIDGTELEQWTPEEDQAAFAVAIEVLEHLERPRRLLNEMIYASTKGIVITTPNDDVVDCKGLDRTHVSPLNSSTLDRWGIATEGRSLFRRNEADTLVGWRACYGGGGLDLPQAGSVDLNGDIIPRGEPDAALTRAAARRVAMTPGGRARGEAGQAL